MIHPNDVPDAPDWECEPRMCPIPCSICTTASESAWMHNAGERLGEKHRARDQLTDRVRFRT